MALRPSEIERTKLRAAYWNGLAIATAAIGFVPVGLWLLTVTEARTAPASWEEIALKASAAFVAFGLSRLFHVLGQRALSALDA